MDSFCFTLKTEVVELRYPPTSWPLIESIHVYLLDTDKHRAVTMDQFLDLVEKYASVVAFNLKRFVWPCLLTSATGPQSMRLRRFEYKFRCAMEESRAIVYYNGDRKYLSLEEAFSELSTPYQADRIVSQFQGSDPEVLKCQKLAVVAERILRA